MNFSATLGGHDAWRRGSSLPNLNNARQIGQCFVPAPPRRYHSPSDAHAAIFPAHPVFRRTGHSVCAAPMYGKAATTNGHGLPLIIVTPHVEGIRREFAEAFSRWHQEKYGRPVAINWRNYGGTSQIVKFFDASRPLYEQLGTYKIDLVWGGGDYLFDAELKGRGIFRASILARDSCRKSFRSRRFQGCRCTTPVRRRSGSARHEQLRHLLQPRRAEVPGPAGAADVEGFGRSALRRVDRHGRSDAERIRQRRCTWLWLSAPWPMHRHRAVVKTPAGRMAWGCCGKSPPTRGSSPIRARHNPAWSPAATSPPEW